MSENNKVFSGGCLCGAVRYEAKSSPQMMGDCFCLDCRKSSGTAHCSHMVMPKSEVKISGEVSHFDKPADSGNIVARCFCPKCGSPVYSLNSAMADFIFLRASSLDDPGIYAAQMSVYTSRAPLRGRIDPESQSFEAMPPSMPGA